MNLYTAVVLIGVGATVLGAETLDVKLGLWEVTSVSQTGGIPPIDTSRMTPEQKAKVEAAFAARAGKPQTTTRKSCLTKEELDKAPFLGSKENDQTCKRDVVSTSHVLKIKAVCSGAQKSTTELNFEAVSRESVKGTMVMNMGEGPRTMTVNATLTGKWLGPVCGDVK
jgi:hypothetical protein